MRGKMDMDDVERSARAPGLWAWLTTPVLLAGALLAVPLGAAFGIERGLVVAVVVVVVGVTIALLELWRPLVAEAPRRPGTMRHDALHMAGSALVSLACQALFFGLFFQAAAALSGALGGALWPVSVSWVVQLPLALLVAELGSYSAHRLCHRFPLLWRIHALHHSSPELYVLSSGRNHPFNVVATVLAQSAPLVVLGAGPDLLAQLSVFTGACGLLQHANLDLRHGALNIVLASAELHRWHHARDLGPSNSNFGNNLIVWDRLLGTYQAPSRAPAEQRLGLDDVSFPGSYWAHLASPFILDRFARSASADAAP